MASTSTRPGAHRINLPQVRIAPEQPEATITLTPDGAECVRRFDGDFVVKLPIMGGTIEKRLLPGILSRFDVEAEALADRPAVRRPRQRAGGRS